MDKSKRFNITLDPLIADEVLKLVACRVYPSFSFAIESLVRQSIRNGAIGDDGRLSISER